MSNGIQMSDTLISRIEQAFDEVEYPGDEFLARSTVGEEAEALVRDFRGKREWRSLSASFLDQAPEGWGTATAFLSPEAFRFYLPAYLIADIRGQLQRADPSGRLCLSLTPQGERKKIAAVWGGGTMGDYARAEFDRYSGAQVSAVVAYLWWKLTSEGANLVIEQAMENYWLEREAESAIEADSGQRR
ncbi:MAG: hypothetical protein PVI37_02735 [Gammaproteobacteria bacterium]|jgi:hypothetical protein